MYISFFWYKCVKGVSDVAVCCIQNGYTSTVFDLKFITALTAYINFIT
jgi:hypothetical protein